LAVGEGVLGTLATEKTAQAIRLFNAVKHVFARRGSSKRIVKARRKVRAENSGAAVPYRLGWLKSMTSVVAMRHECVQGSFVQIQNGSLCQARLGLLPFS
jgi:hypothetical protein